MDTQLKRVHDVLVVKTEEYASDADQIANIRAMAALQEISLAEAVRGAMAKHTTSIYAMINDGKPHSVEKWDEKINDQIIWLLLLKAALIDGAENPQLEV